MLVVDELNISVDVCVSFGVCVCSSMLVVDELNMGVAYN